MNNNCDHIKVLIQIRDLRIGNGIAACIMNYFEYTIQNGISIDFLLNRDLDSPYRNIVLKNGSRLFTMPHDTSKPNKDNVAYIKKIISSGYDILHVNTSGYYALRALRIAKRNGIKARIYHAHNPKEPFSLKVAVRNKLYVEPCKRYANQFAACSTEAGNSVFKGKRFTVIHNAMDTTRYQFDARKREVLRSELNIDDNFVIGVVARFENQKNPFFLIDVFTEFRKICPDAVLIWVGEGSLRDQIQKRIAEKGVNDSVKLLGTRKDANELYSAMDMFLLPSKYEGLGLVFVEAQISGLQCFGSDQVPKDVEITKNMKRLSLNKDTTYWAEEMKKNRATEIDRRNVGLQLRKSDFEISNGWDALQKMYRAYLLQEKN